MSQKDLDGNVILTKKIDSLDRRDNPENCPICGIKLEFSEIVHNPFSGQEYPEMKCRNCRKYFTTRKDL